MSGNAIGDGQELPSLSNGERTVVLVGRTGTGKSATGNSILGRRAFKSRASSSGVTSTCELQTIKLKDGQIINVIDTPGLFDFSAESEFIGKEIVNCIKLAKDSIHAVLLVLSVRTRFTREEEAAFHSLQNLFGSKVLDCMIVVFTGGDELEDNEETLEDYLGRECPEPLKEILGLCENRRVIFNNKTKDETKRSKQVGELLSLVNMVVVKNGGQPYTHDMFVELKGAMKLHDQRVEVDSLKGYSKREISELEEQIESSLEEQLIKRITEMFESKLKEKINEHEQQLTVEQAARLKAEQNAQAAQMKSNDKIHKLNVDLENAKRDVKELRNKRANKWCDFL